jgi:hypothetical protein
MLGALFGQCAGGEGGEEELGELKVGQLSLSSDYGTGHKRPPATYEESEAHLGKNDSFDITFTPRPFQDLDLLSARHAASPRQRELSDRLGFPVMKQYRAPPNCSHDDSEDVRKAALYEMYQAFAVDLHAGMYLTQLTSSREHSEIHCQLMDDLVTLKMDQSNGHIVEFPLTSVSKVYRIMNEEARRAGDTQGEDAAGHLVVVEFMRRKLCFVFPEVKVAQRFLISLEMLIYRAQQQRTKDQRPLTSAIPQRPQSRSQEACPEIASQSPSPTPR